MKIYIEDERYLWCMIIWLIGLTSLLVVLTVIRECEFYMALRYRNDGYRAMAQSISLMSRKPRRELTRLAPPAPVTPVENVYETLDVIDKVT